MSVRRPVAGLLSFVVVAATVGTVGMGAASASPAAPASAHPSAKQVASYHASMRPRAVLDAMHRGTAVSSTGSAAKAVAAAKAAPAVPATGPATVGLTAPTLVYTQVSDTSLAYTILAKNLQTGISAALVPVSTNFCPYEPKMSPDGTKVVYLDYGASCGGAEKLVVLTVGGSTTVIATAGANQFIDLPNWNSDSATILYTLELDDINGFVSSSLFTIQATGGSSTPVTGGGSNAYDGVFSPNGNKIAYAPTVPSNADYLAVMDAAGTNVVNLTGSAPPSTFSPIRPSWSPDGLSLAYQYNKSSTNGVFFDGIGSIKVDNTGNARFGVTGGTTTNAFFCSWSADGTEIFYDALLRDPISGGNITNAAIYATDVLGRRRATVVADTAHAYLGSAFVGPSPSIGSASTFTPVTPTRVQAQVPVGPAAGAFIDVQVSGGASPVPPGATAVTLNLTGVAASQATYLQAYPTPVSGNVAPLVSNLNLTRGQTAAVAVQVAVSATGFIRVRNNLGTTGVIVDVSGYFSAGGGANKYSPITPNRAVDTTLTAGGTTDVQVAALAAGISGLTPVAVVLNLTGSNPSQGTYLSVYPTPNPEAGPPTVSNLNLPGHATRANLVTVPIGDAGNVRVFNAVGSVRAIVDVVGFYGTGATGGLSYFPLAPTRFLDTRDGTDTYLGSTAPVGATVTLQLQLRGSATTSAGMITIPATAAAYVYNLTAVTPSQNTYLTAYPNPNITTLPLASSVNAPPHSVVPNLVITGTDSTGIIGIYNRAGNTPMILDIAGYYAP